MKEDEMSDEPENVSEPATPNQVYSVASHVSAKAGKVREEKPDGVGVNFTPEAALETAERLTEAAVAAKGEEVWGNR